MCGLTGTFYFDNNKLIVSKSLLEEMRDAMSHRGPDGYGSWEATSPTLGSAGSTGHSS